MEAEKIWLNKYLGIHKDIYNISVVKMEPADWIEKHIYLTSDVSRYAGRYSYNRTPYVREIVNRLSSSDGARAVAVMKGAQSGLTQGVIVPGMAYIISEDPAPILFMAGDKELAKKTIETRFDPIMHSSKLSHLIRANVIKARNQKSGDTSAAKEFAGGQMVIEGTNNVTKMRQYSVKNVFADDWEAAPRDDKNEGAIRKLIEGRQTSYGNLAKTFFISTPGIKQTSNIEPVYLLGDQRKWHWECPHCNNWITPEWRIEIEGGEFAGIMFKLDEANRIINNSVHYKCQKCKGVILETQKYKLNLKGKWIATAVPQIENWFSYHLNTLVTPPGFITWTDLAKEWNEACPVGKPIDRGMLKAFNNIRLGLTFEEQGESPKVMQLMRNVRTYSVGVVPDITSDEDQNGKIIMLSLAIDINGIMESENAGGTHVEDVRLDWEVLAHSAKGATYSVNHGSIGTFKRRHEMTASEIEKDFERTKWTVRHNAENSVWPEVQKIIEDSYISESGEERSILISLIDTGFAEKHAMQFIMNHNGIIFGVKGRTEKGYRPIQKDSSPISRSSEKPKHLYIVEVNQIKDDLSEYMKLRAGDDGTQPIGFMNYPQPQDSKYNLKTYFADYEGEKRLEEKADGKVIGYKWEKRDNKVRNHFWDCRVYNLAAPLIYIDLLKRSDSNLKNLTWEDFVAMVTS